MKVSYFPGCTLRTKAKKLDFYARRCAEILGAELCEIENWQCCGGVFVSAGDEIATKLSSVRALKEARDNSRPLVTVCSACHNVIKQTNHAMQTDSAFENKVNLYMSQDKEKREPKALFLSICILKEKISYLSLIIALRSQHITSKWLLIMRMHCSTQSTLVDLHLRLPECSRSLKLS